MIHSLLPESQGWKLPPSSQTFFFPLILHLDIHRGTQWTKKRFPPQKHLFKVQQQTLGFSVTLWFEAVCIVFFCLFFIRSHPRHLTIFFFLFYQRDAHKWCWRTLSALRMTASENWRQEREGSRGVLLPALLWWIHPELVTMEEKGKPAAVRSVPPPAAPNISRVEKPERRVNGWLTAVGLSRAHPSVQLAPVGHLPVTHRLGQLPCGEQSRGSIPQVFAQPTRRVSQHSSSVARAGREVKQKFAGPWLTVLLCVLQAGDSLSVPDNDVWQESCCKT